MVYLDRPALTAIKVKRGRSVRQVQQVLQAPRVPQAQRALPVLALLASRERQDLAVAILAPPAQQAQREKLVRRGRLAQVSRELPARLGQLVCRAQSVQLGIPALRARVVQRVRPE